MIPSFAASVTSTIDHGRVEFVHPRNADAANVLPPVLNEVANDAPGPSAARWLGNIYRL